MAFGIQNIFGNGRWIKSVASHAGSASPGGQEIQGCSTKADPFRTRERTAAINFLFLFVLSCCILNSWVILKREPALVLPVKLVRLKFGAAAVSMVKIVLAKVSTASAMVGAGRFDRLALDLTL